MKNMKSEIIIAIIFFVLIMIFGKLSKILKTKEE